MVVLAGSGALVGEGSGPVTAGQVLAVPAAFGAWRPEGDVRLLVCRPGTEQP